MRDWPAFVRAQLSVDQVDTQLYIVHRADADYLGNDGGASKNAKARFRALCSFWGLRPHLFFLEFPGRAVASSSAALKALRRLAGRGHTRADVWVAVRDAMLARHGAASSVPAPVLADVQAAEEQLNARRAEAAATAAAHAGLNHGQVDANAGDDDENADDDTGAADAKGKGKRRATGAVGGRDARRRRLTSSGSAAEAGRRLSSSFMSWEPSLLEMVGGDEDGDEDDEGDGEEDAARLAEYRGYVEGLLGMSVPNPARDSPGVASVMYALRNMAHTAAIMLDVHDMSRGYRVEEGEGEQEDGEGEVAGAGDAQADDDANHV